MKRISIIAGLIALIAGADVANAQSGSRERIEKELERTQRLMREGRLVRANVRVVVRLSNGSRLKGIVKNGRFMERLDEREFVQTNKRGPNSGLRLWYYDGTDSYIFLPFDQIRRYKIGETLTDEEVDEIAKAIAIERRKSEERRKEYVSEKERKRAEAEAAKNGGAEGTPATPGGETEKPESKLTTAQRALLAEFPPTQGWGLEKLRSLEMRKTTIGVYPNEREKRFIDNYQDWSRAYEILKSEEAAQGGGEDPATPKPSSEKPVTPKKPVSPVSPGGVGVPGSPLGR